MARFRSRSTMRVSIGADAKLETDPTPRVESLTAAHHSPVSVRPDHPLRRATTLMRMWDYSQLPVWTGPKDVKGVVSWKTIGRALADGAYPTTVRECMGEACIIEADVTTRPSRHGGLRARPRVG